MTTDPADAQQEWAMTEEALTIARSLGDTQLTFTCLNNLGVMALQAGRPDDGRVRVEEALAHAVGDAYAGERAILLTNLARAAMVCGDGRHARASLDEAVGLATRLENGKVEGLARLHLGRLERMIGNAEAARAQFAVALELLRAAGHAGLLARAPFHIALSACAAGTVDEARPLLAESLTLWWEGGALDRVPDALRTTAALCAVENRPAPSGRLWGAAAGIAPLDASVLLPYERALLRRLIDAARSGEERDRFVAAEAEGRALDAEAAVALAHRVLGEAEA